MNRPDVDSIVCATDAGREGELIFRLVYQQAGCKKSFSRLWLSSMEDSAIREGFANLKPSTEFFCLVLGGGGGGGGGWVGVSFFFFFFVWAGLGGGGGGGRPVVGGGGGGGGGGAPFLAQKFYTVELVGGGG